MGSDIITPIANCVMAVGALLIFLQIRQSKRQALTDFEDTLSAEYRQIIHDIPAKALLGETLTQPESDACMDELLTYVDLCNEQTFLRQQKRVRRDTWLFWAEGMRSNFSRPAFKQAWGTIKTKLPTDYSELRRLEKTEYQADPATWN